MKRIQFSLPRDATGETFSPVTVPSDFLGLCFMQYPVSDTSPEGRLDFKSLRLSQQYQSQWAVIETSAGVYSASALAALDSIITFARGLGATVMMGTYRTPLFYADSVVANPTYTDAQTKGPWGNLGECAHPTSLTALVNFVSMIITRYNLPGGAWYDANHTTLGKGIQYWEPWNEPKIIASSNNGNTTGVNGPGTGFYWGSKNQLVDLCHVQYETIKALDSSVIVCSPGHSELPTTIASLLNTAGSAYPAISGADTCEAIAWHPYKRSAKYNTFGNWQLDLVDSSTGIRTLRNAIIQSGHDFPLWITEWGVDASGSSAELTAWYAVEASFRYTWIMRCFMTMAAYGVQCVHPWHWGSDCCFGDMQDDVDGVQLAYNTFGNIVVGKTIVGISNSRAGPVTLTFADGSSLTV